MWHGTGQHRDDSVSLVLTLAVRWYRQESCDPHRKSEHGSGNGREREVGWKKGSGSNGTGEVVGMGRAENQTAE